MRGRTTLAVAFAGMTLLAPAAAFAQESPTATPTTTSTTTPPPEEPPLKYPFVAVSLAPAAPGGEVLVSVGCEPDKLGDVTSKALDLGKFEVTSERPKPIFGAVGHVHRGLRNGFYQVIAYCGGIAYRTNFEVKGAKPPATTSPAPTKKPGHGGQVSRIPAGAPQTGGGGVAG